MLPRFVLGSIAKSLKPEHHGKERRETAGVRTPPAKCVDSIPTLFTSLRLLTVNLTTIGTRLWKELEYRARLQTYGCNNDRTRVLSLFEENRCGLEVYLDLTSESRRYYVIKLQRLFRKQA